MTAAAALQPGIDEAPVGETGSGRCPVCDRQPRALLVIAHAAMRRFTSELLEREVGCSIGTETHSSTNAAQTPGCMEPDVVIIDAADFPRCCETALPHIERGRIIVIGPEPEPAYQAAALGAGAGAWVARDQVGDQLAIALRRLLRCTHRPCPRGQQVQGQGSPRSANPQ